MQRDAYFDNARLLLIFLVVFGHLIQPFTNDSLVGGTLYMWIYFFHMPAFIMIAGFFARGSKNKEYLGKLAKRLLVPYILFQLTYTGFYYFIGKSSWQSDLLYPQWSLWFLISLFCWHVLLILFKNFRPVYGIILALMLELMIGYVEDVGHYFSLSRTFVFFPYFLIGYWLKKEHIIFLKQKVFKYASIAILLVTVGVVFILSQFNLPNLDVGWLLASKSYASLNAVQFGGVVRLLIYTISLILAFSVLIWVPQRKFRFTYLGTRTLYVYLLHGFIVQTARQFDLFSVTSPLDIIGLGGVSALIVFVLSHKWVMTVWQPLIEGRATMLRAIRDND